MNAYLAIKNRHSDEFGDFPMFFAFSNEQFEKGMEKFGLEMTETDKLYKGFAGGYYKKTDAKRLKELLSRHHTEMEQAIKDDINGDGFIFDMFDYELANHEYAYSLDVEDTLEALGISHKDIKENKNLANGLENAITSNLSQGE